MDDNEKYFHGKSYSIGPWNSQNYTCCRLCKTRNKNLDRTKHWSKGLCKSCYRRLNFKHRLYNEIYLQAKKIRRSMLKSGHKDFGYIYDLSSKEILEHADKLDGFKETKTYKLVSSGDEIVFSPTDVDTLLDRYNWRCAYSKVRLQGYDHKKINAFQLEYITTKSGEYALVPVSRKVNCSKKHLKTEQEIEQWCKKRGLDYPIKYISVEDYLNED